MTSPSWPGRERAAPGPPPGRPPGPAPGPPPGRALTWYLRLLGPVLGGYLAFDKAFAYLHLPGTPLFVGELTLLVGLAGVVTGTGYLWARVREEPVLVLVAAFAGWGLARTLPGVPVYGLDAVRDAALWYYSLFALLTVAALARAPRLLDDLLDRLARFVPWLLAWLPLAVVLAAVADRAPAVPGSSVSVLTHKTGNAVVAALVALGSLWLVPGRPGTRRPGARRPGGQEAGTAQEARTAQEAGTARETGTAGGTGTARRAGWTAVAGSVVLLAATQNRGGLLAAVAAGAVGLVYVPRAVRRAVVRVTAGCLLATVAVLLTVPIPVVGAQGRQFSVSQLAYNVLSFGGSEVPGNLNGTAQGRMVLWSRVFDRQVATGHLLDGSGFGRNLATEVGIFDAGTDALRSPHNSHLDVLARMGLLGLGLWLALWACWYRRMAAGCRRLAREGRQRAHGVSVLCMMVVTAILVSSFFDPQLEGAQVAALLWTVVGVGLTVTRGTPGHAPAVPRTGGGR